MDVRFGREWRDREYRPIKHDQKCGFLPEVSFGLQVLSLPVSVCEYMCVCQSLCQSLACPRDNSGPVQAKITKFGPKAQNNLVKWSDRP